MHVQAKCIRCMYSIQYYVQQLTGLLFIFLNIMTVVEIANIECPVWICSTEHTHERTRAHTYSVSLVCFVLLLIVQFSFEFIVQCCLYRAGR
jgi:hypothetical protein